MKNKINSELGIIVCNTLWIIPYVYIVILGFVTLENRARCLSCVVRENRDYGSAVRARFQSISVENGANHLQPPVADALQVVRSTETSDLSGGQSRRLKLRVSAPG